MLNIKTIWGDSIPVSLRYSGSFRHRADFCSGYQRGKYTQPSKPIKLYSFDNPHGSWHSYCARCLKEFIVK